MLTSVVVRIVDFCSRQAWLVIVTSLLVAIACSFYTARHFAINSDINALLSDDIGWRKREHTFEEAFGRFDRITVVVQAPTPELASTATAELAKALKERTDRFRSVNQPAGGEFFARNGLLFLPTDELTKNLNGLVQAEALINDLATDESLRGLTSSLGDVLLGIQSEKVKLDDVAPVFDKFSTTIEDVVAGRPASFSWQALSAAKRMLTSCAALSMCVRSSITRRSNPARRRPQRSARSLPTSRQNIRRRCGSPDRLRWPTRNSPPSRKISSSTA